MAALDTYNIAALDGTALDATSFDNKAVLIVNVASKCGLTPQYEALEALHRDVEGLCVLGVPCNQFGAQEPGSPDEIQAFCKTRYDVSFPLTEKVDVNGDARHPLYAWLTAATAGPEAAGDIGWNFTKFVIGRDGQVKARFAPATAPDDPSVKAAITAALSA